MRSPALLGLGLAMLAAAVALGAVLVHDGEVGTDEAALPGAGPGDVLRLKGAVAPHPPVEGAPGHLHVLDHGVPGVVVLVAAEAPLAAATYVVEGQVVLRVGGDPVLLVLGNADVLAPLLFG